MTKNDDKISLTGYVEQFLGFLATAEVFFVLLSTVILSLSSLPIQNPSFTGFRPVSVLNSKLLRKQRKLMASAPANLWVLLGLGLAGILIMTKKLKKNKVVKQDFGAFVLRFQLLPPPQPSPPKAPHPLTGLTFAVSDV